MYPLPNLVVASSCTYPLILVRTVMQDHRTQEKMGFLKVCKFIGK